MEALGIVDKGFEDIALMEIEELIGAKGKQRKGCVLFETKKTEDLARLCYRSQSLNRVVLLISKFNVNDNLLKKAKEEIEKADLSKWLGKDTTFSVRCIKDNDDFSGQEIESEFGEFIVNNIEKTQKRRQKADLKNPDVQFLAYLNEDSCFFGVDFAGFDLGKRQYKIFMHSASLRGTLAYSLMRLSGFSKEKKLLDPFCGSGTIPIEAALFASGFPVQYYTKEKLAFNKLKCFSKEDFKKIFKDGKNEDKHNGKTEVIGHDTAMKYVQYSKKNAKIAGIDKLMKFSRVSAEDLDIKYGTEIDCIATQPPLMSKLLNRKDLEKVYKELFYQADFILKKDGKMAVLTNDPEAMKSQYEQYNFREDSSRAVAYGNNSFTILVLRKK
ncbi:methyltransferase [Candidatus Woesearchaeota archaeon]|nr:methyltransferase [Candidatus Woesearchaeota archaeon]